MPNSAPPLSRILVVEDEGVVASDIERCLEDGGFEVTGVAASADDAVEEASKVRPDLVLMDIRIQGSRDGIETGHILHQQFGVPILYLTAHGDRDTIERAKKTEPFGFLLKPFKPAELTSAVQIALDRARANKELRKREGSFFLALESIPDAVLSVDEQASVRFVNRAAAALTGWTGGEALERPITEIVTVVNDGRSCEAGPLRALLDTAAENAGAETEFRILDRNGASHWVAGRAAGMTGVDGGSIRVVILQEITKRKEMLQTLQRQADLLDQAHEPIFTRHLRGAITYWNHAAEVLYGFSRKEAMGRSVTELLATVHVLGSSEIDISLARDGRWRGELIQTTKDGRQIVVESAMVTVSESNGCTTVLETHRDITERKRVDKEIRRLNAELEQRVRDRTAQLEAANKELGAFAYSVSHDLRAPLRGIDGWSLALEEEYGAQLDPQANGYLQRVRSETQRMGMLIDDLLQLSRVTRSEIRYDRVDLTSLASTIAARLREAQPGRPMEFLIAPGLTAVGDARLLDIALSNLLGNAAKFTAPRIPARIEFGQAQENGAPAYYVRDNGVGFDMAYASTLFGAFQRLHKASEFPGTGIGLATVQRIIHRHGGGVWAKSAPDQGATFYFTLSNAGPIPEGSSDDNK